MVVTGFDKRPVVKITPLSKEELEQLIIQRVIKTDRPDIHKDVRIDYTSTVKDDDRASTLAEVMDSRLLMNVWESVKVLEVDYNEINQIVRIKLDVVYPESHE